MKNQNHHLDDAPPEPADRFLAWFCDPYFLPDIQGDLHELFYKRLRSSGRGRARYRYYLDVARSVRPYALRRDLFSIQSTPPAMFRNYIKSGFRHVRQHLGYSFINIFGLAVGIACCLLIFLYVDDELSYDRHHEKGDRIYRVLLDRHEEDGDMTIDATTPSALAPALKHDIAGIEEAVRIFPPWGGEVLVSRGDMRFYESRVYMADPEIFDVFTFPLIEGNPKTALSKPDAVLLTESMARKYFADENPMGQLVTLQNRVTMQNQDYLVTGVLADLPEHLHFSFDFLISIYNFPGELDDAWGWWNYYTYVLLEEHFSPEQFATVFPSFIDQYQEEVWGVQRDLHLQSIADIHLHSNVRWEIEPNSDIVYIYIFSAVAVLLLLIACANFMNLATARSARRATEVGMRKVIGARRTQVLRQFLFESVTMSMIALLFAFLLVQLALPAFNLLSGKSMHITDLGTIQLVLLVPGIVLVVGLLAGSYPAMVLSRFEPIAVLKGHSTKTAAALLRKGLVVFQFSISVFLIIGTMTIHRQLTFIQNKKLGFDKEQVVVIPIRDGRMHEHYDSFKQSLIDHPSIAGMTASSGVLGGINWTTSVEVEGMEEELRTNLFMVDYDFVETLGMTITQGRSFSREFATDSSAMILNEAALRQVGLENPLGKTANVLGRQTNVVGVVEDFHFQSFHHTIESFALVIGRLGLSHIEIRINTHDMRPALAAIQDTWSSYFPDIPLDYDFLDFTFSEVHVKEQRLGTIFRCFSVLTIFIACLGLLGLAAFSAEQRKKEVGIRKVMGASVSQIIALLSEDFMKLVVAALVVSIPLSYIAVHQWLNGFAYRIPIKVDIFVIAGMTALGIALLTVGYQAAKAACSNPVKTLRYE